MTEYRLNRFELSQYSFLRSQVMELDERIREIEAELTELDQYNFNISPVYTGMPTGNERRDKIADFIIKMENDKRSLQNDLTTLIAEREAAKYRLHKIRTAVKKIPNRQLRNMVMWHYFEGQRIKEIAEKEFLSENAVYKRINRLFRHGSSCKSG